MSLYIGIMLLWRSRHYWNDTWKVFDIDKLEENGREAKNQWGNNIIIMTMKLEHILYVGKDLLIPFFLRKTQYVSVILWKFSLLFKGDLLILKFVLGILSQFVFNGIFFICKVLDLLELRSAKISTFAETLFLKYLPVPLHVL